MDIVLFDFEVFKYDWVVVIKNIRTETYEIYHNDPDSLNHYLFFEELILCGFNNKHYDNHILKAVMGHFPPTAVKELNDFIISGNNGWDYKPLKEVETFYIPTFDLKDDMQDGLSLKAIEGHMGMDIRETTVPFDIDRPLTEAELDEVIQYCRHDVDATHELLKLRKNYLDGKINLGRMANIPDTKALYATNAKLTAMFLGAKKQDHSDERMYVYPDNLLKEWIPQEVFDFFDRLKDPSIPDEEIFGSKLELDVNGTPTVMGFGGIHAAIPNFIWKETGSETIRNMDVASYYPSMIVINGYASRNIPNPDAYRNIYEKRIKAKKEGDKQTANTLKLVLNTKYGATLNQYNDLYDPLMARSICISGQLYLLELAEHLVHDIEGLKIVQLNTDGIMFLCDQSKLEDVYTITNEWQERTHFGLEEDTIKVIAQKDVNNYVMIDGSGHEKSKGGYVVRGIAPAGAFNINNNACVVAKAVKDYFINGTAPEDTINACDDITQYQLIAKAGGGYSETFQLVNGEEIPTQRVNRVYSTNKEEYGTLYKRKPDGSTAKIGGLPDHCIIDNENILDISVVDRQFYIDLAKKQINDYLGIKPTKKGKKAMATKAETPVKMNIAQKLLQARIRFMESDVKKTGKHMYLKYKYFTLDDIVPVAERIFNELGILCTVNFAIPLEGAGNATMIVCDVEDPNNPSNTLVFNVPMPVMGKMEQITPVQELGANITYLRRYLYMLALDITEVDITDEGLTEEPTAAEKKTKVPVSKDERTAIKKDLTNKDGQATDAQKKQLKNGLRKLLLANPDMQEQIEQIMETFEDITKEQCETLMVKVGEMLKDAE